MFLRLILFLCFPVFFLMSSSLRDIFSTSTGSVPSWVEGCDFVKDSPVKSSQIHLQQLLFDTQNNWEENTIYFHRAIKVLDEIGADGISQLSFLFDPSYENIVVHSIGLHRDGKWLDRLENCRHNLIQQEGGLKNGVYSGKLTLIYFLDDVREGDILEYAFSFIGANPAFYPYHEDLIFLQKYEIYEKIYHRILLNPERPIFIKSFHSCIEPSVKSIHSNLTEWVWKVQETRLNTQENLVPAWYNPLECIQVTQYSSWEEAAKQILPLFLLPLDFETNVNPEMLALVQTWMGSTSDKTELAWLAIKFVQDKVRYFGFEEGIGSIKPSNPNITFQRRYGDCKDKTILLQALLQLMGIHSKPVLVDTNRRISELLPTLKLFNHVVLQLQIDNSFYWVDSTRTLQEGSLSNIYFPDYEWGLIISENTSELTPIPKIILQKPTEIDTSIILVSPDMAEFKTTLTFYDMKADIKRNELKNRGYTKFSDHYLKIIQRHHNEAIFESLLTISDDRTENIFTISASYRIPTGTYFGKKWLSISSYVINDYLDQGVKSDRMAPYALDYPLWVKEHIHVKNSFNQWTLASEDKNFNHEVFVCKYITKMEGQTADFDFEIKYLKDHVPSESIKEYRNIINKIVPNDSFELIIADSKNSP